MIDNRLRVSTKFAGSNQNLEARVHFGNNGHQLINNNSSREVGRFPNDNSILNIEVVNGDAPVKRTDRKRNLFIKFDSREDFAYHVSTTERGWAISKKRPCLFSREPVMVNKLPKALNKWYFRLIVLPAEAAWFLIKVPLALTAAFFHMMMSVMRGVFNEANPETTNITVGAEEE
jgi:hypothetical protein